MQSISHLYDLFAIFKRRPSPLRPLMRRDGVMFAGSDSESRLPELQDQLRRAHDVTPDLMSQVVAGAGTRFTKSSCAGKAAWIDRLIASEA
jgi:hypothetical protein